MITLMSEMMNQPPPSGGVPVLEPKSIKVFGILHIVFGCIGALQLLMGVANLLFGDAFLKLQSGGDEQVLEMQRGMAEEMKVATLVALVLMAVVTFFILRAGVKLLKSKKDAVKASSVYSFASIGAKVVSLILAVTYTIPALNRYFDNLTEQMGGAGSSQLEAMMQMMKMTTSVTGVISPILMCIYPLLSLFLLKKKNVGEYLEQFGK
ncbi:MAG: hypothetical protein ACSHYB_10930 [Roseibacillus sp.]